jgi:peptidoglycan/LPS O-acetylase OafA/YrhL
MIRDITEINSSAGGLQIPMGSRLCYCGAGFQPFLMATCPRCKGHLTDSHKCPRRPAVVATEITAVALAGAVAGLVLVAIFDTNEQITNLDLILVVAAGASICVGIRRMMRG